MANNIKLITTEDASEFSQESMKMIISYILKTLKQ